MQCLQHLYKVMLCVFLLEPGADSPDLHAAFRAFLQKNVCSITGKAARSAGAAAVKVTWEVPSSGPPAHPALLVQLYVPLSDTKTLPGLLLCWMSPWRQHWGWLQNLVVQILAWSTWRRFPPTKSLPQAGVIRWHLPAEPRRSQKGTLLEVAADQCWDWESRG